jgi:hypothetical protein
LPVDGFEAICLYYLVDSDTIRVIRILHSKLSDAFSNGKDWSVGESFLSAICLEVPAFWAKLLLLACRSSSGGSGKDKAPQVR